VGGAVPLRACLAVVLASALACVAVAAARGQERNAFTVTGPTGVYSRTTADVAHWTRIARRTGATRPEARAQVMQLLVSFAWLEGEADEQGLAVSPAAVGRSFRRQRRANFPRRRAFRRFLRQSGQTVGDIRLRVRLDMLSNRIRRRVIAAAEATVTDARVDAYHAQQGNVRIPERRDVRMVLTNDRESAAAAKRELLAGASWRAVARRHSNRIPLDAPPAGPGGIIRGLERIDFDRRTARRIFRARRRAVVGPVRTSLGHLVFRVVRSHPARELSPARSRRILRRDLVARTQQEALDRFVEDYRAKWQSRTVCAPAYAVVVECGGTDPGA
jgi:parvulin-like peptidyl-prolyl cis-trans isomerase-like protein